MSPLVAEAIRLADEYAALMCAYEYWSPIDQQLATEHRVNCDAKRAALLVHLQKIGEDAERWQAHRGEFNSAIAKGKE